MVAAIVCAGMAHSADRPSSGLAAGGEQLDFALSIDTVSGLPNDEVTVHISLDNARPVAGFQLLIDYDPTMASVTAVDNTGDRSALFEQFDVVLNPGGYPGRVRITAKADLAGGPQVAPLAAGSGAIAHITMRLSHDLNLIGLATSIPFVLTNRPSNLDNTLTDGAGVTVQPTDIAFTAGQVMVEDLGQLKIGDINLNGVAFEIGDAILLTNYIMSPQRYPLNIEQLANSDVNADGYAASVADLVFMINRLATGASAAGDDKDAQ